MPIREIHFDEPDGFLDYLRESKSHWRTGTSCDWVFRGQPNAEWKLVPSAFREEGRKILGSITRRYAPLSDEVWSFASEKVQQLQTAGARARLEAMYFQTKAEIEAVAQFAAFADRLGFRIPKPPVELPDIDLKVKWEASLGTAPHNIAGEFGPIFGFAQHHGVPTRLLDWTRRSVVAAYFAVADIRADANAERLAVWAVNTKAPTLGTVVSTMVCAQADHAFLHAQSGMFLYHPRAHSHYLQHGCWPAIDDALAQLPSAEANVRKITLPVKCAAELSARLFAENVTRADLMPTLDNVVVTLRRRWEVETQL